MPIVKETPFGTRQRQEFQVALGIDTSKADSIGQGIGLLYSKNIYWDRQLGAAFARGGSSNISLLGLTATPALPLSIGEYVSSTANGQIQVDSTALIHCTGGEFRSIDSSSSAAVTTDIVSNIIDETRPSQQCMGAGSKLFIATGKLCTWAGPGKPIYQHGLNAPTQAAQTIVNSATSRGDVGGDRSAGGDITLTDGCSHVYTYYSSTTGLESDWSPVSLNTGAITDASITVTVYKDGLMDSRIDKIRIYRTLDGGTKPYLVTTIDLPTDATYVTYTDNSLDDVLTAYIGKRGDRAQIQGQTFIVAAYANHMWTVDSVNPRLLRFSKPYTGSDNDLEYWPTNNYVATSEPITALLKVPGKLLVFHPRSISYVSGTSIDDFQINTFKAGIGTVMPQSVATDGKNIVFLSEQGWANLASEQLIVSREIDEELREIMEGSYNVAIRAMAVYNYGLRQFICIISAQGTATQPWTNIDTEEMVLWEDTVTTNAAVWETETGYVPTASLRNKVWGYSPDIVASGNRWCEYVFTGMEDGSGSYPTCCLYRQPSNKTGTIRNNSMLLGWYTATGLAKLWRIFDDSAYLDDAATFDAELLTDRASPGIAGGRKHFTHLQIPTDFSDITGTGAYYGYLLEYDSPSLRSNWRDSILYAQSTNGENKALPSGLGKFIHAYVKKTIATAGELILQNFYIHFREKRNRGNR